MKAKPTVKAKGVYRGKETMTEERKEATMPMGYKNGGYVKKMANGGMVAPNARTGAGGPGVRSDQSCNYKKK